ncbi:sensor histidine kinase [Cohnella thailandensis]|uniref:Histidine kinase n=1 Tax=Cohnella thailandensis TaxID=557557 RepID=A0A841STD4_9BACL|nr:histidine kinase [Cohnella thailandensis]MBB6633170.1 histidine kinase [Cohnella thailandensis]MBP1975134.1 sensor histidine kinase YesM [Cohnella thailandensis]
MRQWINGRRGTLSLKSKLFLLLIAISVLPSVVVFTSSQHYMFRSNTQYSISISNQYLRTVSSDIVTYLQNLTRSFDPLIVDYDFQQFLQAARDDYSAQARLSARFRPLIDHILQSRNQHLTGVLYLDRSNKTLYESYDHSLNFDYSFADDPYYGTIPGTESVTLSSIHSASYVLGSPLEVVSLVIPIADFRTGDYSAWLVLEIESGFLRGKLNENAADSGSNLLLFNSGTGELIANSGQDPALSEQLRTSLASDPAEGEAILFQAGRTNYEAAYRSISYGDWKLVWFASLETLTSGVKHSLRVMILVASLSVLAASFIAFPVMKIVFRPLTHLKMSIRNLSRGVFLPVTVRHQNDEIGFLVQTFNKMLVDLKQLEKEVGDSRNKEKERELLQLQAQINPHFLFNTLETIESYAYRSEPDAVGSMVQSVSRIMRYNIRKDGGWAALREELDYIRDYLRIHAFRSGAEAAVEWDIDPLCLEEPVMKLSVQPFVENALKYGWNPNLGPDRFRIRIRAGFTAEGLEFQVTDTGEGTPMEIRDKIERMEERLGISEDPYFQSHTGIQNIYRRFFLAYGDRVRFEMKPNLPHGTTVRWTIRKESIRGSGTPAEGNRILS